MEVAPNLYQLEIPSPNNMSGPVNVYLIADGEALMLIDAGYGGKAAFQVFTDQLETLGFQIKQIKRILITHLHPDHYGMVKRLKEASETSLEFHQAELEMFGPADQSEQGAMFRNMLTWLRSHGVPEGAHNDPQARLLPDMGSWTPSKPDRFVADGEPIRWGAYQFETIITPGHSPGHICLYERARQLMFVGDLVLQKETPNIGLHFGGTGNPLKQYLASLDAVAELSVKNVLPGHGKPFAELRGRVNEIRAHHDERLGVMLDILAEGPKTAYDVAAKVPWGLQSLAWDEYPPFQKYFALVETLAHLKFLVDRGAVLNYTEAGLMYYAINT